MCLKYVSFVTYYVEHCVIEVLNGSIGVRIEERPGNPASPLFSWSYVICDSKQHNAMGLICFRSARQESHDDDGIIITRVRA